MPQTKEGFHWWVPDGVRRIVIGERVTVTGGFRVWYRAPDNPLYIVGADRRTSRIFGTNEQAWTTKNNIADWDKWKYGAIAVMAPATVYVSDLTSENPRGYNISGYAPRAILNVARCNLLDTRPGDNNNSDGFIGAAGSSITDSFISTSDDAIKIYNDMTIKNVTIEQHRNGAPIQFGWGNETGNVKATIENLLIKGVSPDRIYNMAPFSWEAGTTGTRSLTVTNMKVILDGNLWDSSIQRLVPIGLFKLNPPGCTFNGTFQNADIGNLGVGIRKTQGTIILNGRRL